MASSDTIVIDTSVLKQNKAIFDKQKRDFTYTAYGKFKTSYFCTCSDPVVSRMRARLESLYKSIESSYNSIGVWWDSYNSNVLSLENALSGQSHGSLDSGIASFILSRISGKIKDPITSMQDMFREAITNPGAVLSNKKVQNAVLLGSAVALSNVTLTGPIFPFGVIAAKKIASSDKVKQGVKKVASTWWKGQKLIWKGVLWSTKKTCATVTTASLSLLEGIGKGIGGIIDLGAYANAVVKAPTTAVVDLVSSAFDGKKGVKFTITKKMFSDTRKFVEKEYVKDTFDKFYNNTKLGRGIKNNAIGFKYVRIGGNITGEIALDVAAAVVSGGTSVGVSVATKGAKVASLAGKLSKVSKGTKVITKVADGGKAAGKLSKISKLGKGAKLASAKKVSSGLAKMKSGLKGISIGKIASGIKNAKNSVKSAGGVASKISNLGKKAKLSSINKVKSKIVKAKSGIKSSAGKIATGAKNVKKVIKNPGIVAKKASNLGKKVKLTSINKVKSGVSKVKSGVKSSASKIATGAKNVKKVIKNPGIVAKKASNLGKKVKLTSINKVKSGISKMKNGIKSSAGKVVTGAKKMANKVSTNGRIKDPILDAKLAPEADGLLGATKDVRLLGDNLLRITGSTMGTATSPIAGRIKGAAIGVTAAVVKHIIQNKLSEKETKVENSANEISSKISANANNMKSTADSIGEKASATKTANSSSSTSSSSSSSSSGGGSTSASIESSVASADTVNKVKQNTSNATSANSDVKDNISDKVDNIKEEKSSTIGKNATKNNSNSDTNISDDISNIEENQDNVVNENEQNDTEDNTTNISDDINDIDENQDNIVNENDQNTTENNTTTGNVDNTATADDLLKSKIETAMNDYNFEQNGESSLNYDDFADIIKELREIGLTDDEVVETVIEIMKTVAE